MVQTTLPAPPNPIYTLEAAVDMRALAAVTKTDVPLAGFDPHQIMPGVSLTRGCCHSARHGTRLAFCCATRRHGCSTSTGKEIQVGIRTRPGLDGPEAEVFLADRLENGAGYATYLGRDAVFASLIAQCARQLPHLLAHSGGQCDSVCHDCLREYSNMAHHGLLDWRLAMDMVRLARGETIQLDGYWQPLAGAATAVFAAIFGWTPQAFGPLPGLVRGDMALIVGHPLWRSSGPMITNELRRGDRRRNPCGLHYGWPAEGADDPPVRGCPPARVV